MHDRLAGKRAIRLLCVLDEFSRMLDHGSVTLLTSKDVAMTLTQITRLHRKRRAYPLGSERGVYRFTSHELAA